MKNTFISFVLFSIAFCGCKSNEVSTNEADIYGIVTAINDHVTREKMIFFAFPAPPPVKGLNLDSILESNKKKDTLHTLQNIIRKNGRLIVAIDSVLSPVRLSQKKHKYLGNCLDFSNTLKSTQETINIDVSQIPFNDYSFIIPYKEDYKNLPRGGFEKFDIYLKLTNPSFNNDRTKAMLIVGVSYGRLNGFSVVYFLEKKNSKWLIKCKKGLTIS